MPAGDSIIFKAGVDAAGVRQGVKEAVQEVEKGTKAVEAANGRSGGGIKLKSSNRVAHQITNVTQAFLAGSSAADILGVSVVALEKSLRLPLGTLAGLGVGLLVFEKMRESAKELDEFNRSVAETLTPTAGGDYESTAGLEQRLTKLKDLQDKLNDSSAGTGFSKAAGQVGNYLFSGFDAAEKPSAQNTRSEQQTAAILKDIEETKAHLAEHEEHSAQIQELSLNGEERRAEIAKIELQYAEKIGDAYKRQAGELAKALEHHEDIAKRQQNLKSDLSDIDLLDTAVDAVTGRGEGERLSALKAHLANSHKRSARLDKETPNATREKIAEHAHAKTLENQIAELEEHRDESVEHATTPADIMQAEISGHRTIAEHMRIEAEYADRLAQAQRDRNQGLVEQLQREQALTLHRADVDDFLKSPAQRRAERAEARRHSRAEHTVTARDRDLKDRLARGAHARHRLGDHALGERGQPIARLDPAAQQLIQDGITTCRAVLQNWGWPLP